MRWLCILFPQLALDAVLRSREDANAPLVLLSGPPQRRGLQAVNESARAQGLRSGQSLTHARMLQVLFPALRLIRLPGGGHPCTQVLRAISRTGLIQRLALGEAAAAGALQQAHRQARGQSAGYWTALGRAAAARRQDLATAAGWRAANLAAADTGGVDEDGDSA